MRTSTILTTAALLFPAALAAFAGGPAACAAQTEADSKRERLHLSAAIEEARRSPFHTGAEVGESVEAHRARTGIAFALEPSVLQLAPSDEDSPSRWSHVPATLVVAGLSHYTAALGCVFGGAGGCILLPIAALVATPVPALLAGADSRRAFGASTAGLLLGAAAFVGAIMVAENFYVAIAASSLVHAGFMTAALGQG